MSADEVRVSPFDLGLAIGHGVFDTMPAYEGRVFMLERHLERLNDSCEKLGLMTVAKEGLEQAVFEVLDVNGLTGGRARVRLSVSGGVNLLVGGDVPGCVVITAAVQPGFAPVAKLVVSPYVINERSALAGVKSTSYGPNLMAYRDALEKGADEALMLNTRDKLCEGATSNVFLVKEEGVLTPSLESGCLPGVTRSVVMEVCEELQVPVWEKELSQTDLLEAEEIFITSSGREVQPAVLGQGDGAWEVTARIAARYESFVGKGAQA